MLSGEKVKLVAGESARAHVYGILFYDKDDVGKQPPQRSKYLVLREEGTGIFFIGSFTEWRRVRAAGRGKFDVDNDKLVMHLSEEEMVAMEHEFSTSTELSGIEKWTHVNTHNAAVHLHGPPCIKHAREQVSAPTFA